MSTPLFRLSRLRHRRSGPVLALCALLLQTLLPLAQAIPANGQPGGYLLLCTAGGWQRVPLADDAPVASVQTALSCPLCRLHATAATVWPPYCLPLLWLRAEAPLLLLPCVVTPVLPFSLALARGPPVVCVVS